MVVPALPIRPPFRTPMSARWATSTSLLMDSGKDTFVWMQNAEPISLFCADETDGESLRACEQVTEALLTYEIGGTAVKPALATVLRCQ